MCKRLNKTMKKINLKIIAKRIFLIALVVLANSAFAQKVQRSTISSFGSSFQNESIFIHSSFSQNSIVGTVSNEFVIIRQGFEQPQYRGCTDPNACNYSFAATYDDGSCRYDVLVENTHYICQGEFIEIGDNIYENSGVYSDTLTAANQCDSIIITNLYVSDLSISVSSEFTTCDWSDDGSAVVETSNGIPPFTYEWSNGQTTSQASLLDNGTYYVIVSDSACIITDTVEIINDAPPANFMNPEICYVTVDDNTGFNKIVVSPVNSSNVAGYSIYKEVLTDVYYPVSNLASNETEFIDPTSNPLISSFKYKVSAFDICMVNSDTSGYHKTVHLSMNVGLNGVVNLDWDEYDGFPISSYMLFRGSNVANLQFIGFVPGGQTSYTDLNPPLGTSIYQVRVVAPICNPSNPLASISSTTDTLKSNFVEHEIIEENDDLGVNLIVNQPTCSSCNDGSIVAIAFGGAAPYTYTWLNGVYTSLNLNLSSGNYTVYISDSEGTLVTETVTLSALSSDVYGCTDQSATNFNYEATEDDGSCEYPVVDNPCDITPSGLFVDNIIHERVAFNWSAPSSAPSYYMIRYRPVGTSSWTVMSAGPQNDVPFTGTTRARYFMEPGTTYQWNIRARVVDENGATVCQSPWSASHQYTTLPACANLTDLSVNSEANLVYFNANKPSGDWGVWQAKGKIREVGSNNYRYLATTLDNYTNQIKYNFTPSTDYEWHTKAWCTGNVDEDGNSDPQYHSGWGEFSAFTTQDPCDKLPTNLSTTSGNNANTAITMSWDTPTSGQPHHYFLELTNETTGQVFSWNNLAASSTSKTKYGQSSGDQFKWRIRGACGENGTSWATSFTGYEYYTLGGDRLGNDSQSNNQLTNISVYPNPSRGEFNISFDLESRQDVYLTITNYLGEMIFTKELKDQEGQYNKTIDLGNKANGIYMLNITTNNQNINQKIVIQ